MAITAEMVKEFADEPAVFGCKVSAGAEIEPKHLEHPMFLSDMVSSNLFVLDEALTIGQVVGVKAVKDCEALTPVTEESVGHAVKLIREEKTEEPKVGETSAMNTVLELQDGSTIIISIKEGKDIDLELPLF